MLTNSMLELLLYLGLVATKPVLGGEGGGSDKARLKPNPQLHILARILKFGLRLV